MSLFLNQLAIDDEYSQPIKAVGDQLVSLFLSLSVSQSAKEGQWGQGGGDFRIMNLNNY